MGRRWAEENGCFEALVPTTDGDLGEGTVSNLFCVIGGTLVTPPLSRGILPGIVRGRILAACRRLEIEVREDSIHPEDLGGAGEVILTGSGVGPLPVDEIHPEARRLPGASGDFAARLREAYAGEVEKDRASPFPPRSRC
jgi:branched-subunit amino acid aminotransferase/4-amino-4-deoxychorismate lyase